MLDPQARPLRQEIIRLMRGGWDSAVTDDQFADLALRVFSFQCGANKPFAGYCRRRGRTPDSVRHWTEIPAVPAAAFAEVPLIAGDPASAEAEFLTSGTSRGPRRRGRHLVPDLALYHEALLSGFRANLLPDQARLHMISLVPPATEAPRSSLAHMVSTVMAEYGVDPLWFATAGGQIDYAGLDNRLSQMSEQQQPVCLLGTNAAFIHWLDRLQADGRRHTLPAGSRLMDTGGFKGRGRDVPPDELRAGYAELLGLEPDYCVNEYGMTELCSQFYDGALRRRLCGGRGEPRSMAAPGWVRTLVVDPESLEPLPPGSVGLLRHYDLANLGSVLAVQTDDMGRRVEDGFLLLGRAGGAPPRGCSLAMDDLLREYQRTDASGGESNSSQPNRLPGQDPA